MTDQLQIDRMLLDTFRGGPQTAPSASVDRALAEAATERQRRAWPERLNPRAWPPREHSVAHPVTARMLRMVMVAALLGLTIVTALGVGATLLQRFTPIPPRPPSIVSAGRLPDGIGSFIAVALPDGRLVLAGHGQGTAVAGIFDPRTGATVIVPVATTANIEYAALLAGGRVVMYGSVIGEDGMPQRASFWLLDPKTLVVAASAADLNIPVGARLTLMDDGWLLLTTRGEGSGAPAGQMSVARFDPRSGVLQSLPNTPASTSSGGYAVSATTDGRLLIVDDFGNENGPNADVRVYDPRTGAGRLVGRIHQDRYYLSASPVRLTDGRWLIVGGEATRRCGSDGLHPVQAHVFDPATDALVQIADLPHSIGTATAVADGRIALTGSWSTQGESCDFPERVTDQWIGLYDPATGLTVESRNPISLQGTLPVDISTDITASLLLANGDVALVGLVDKTSQASVDVFSPGTP